MKLEEDNSRLSEAEIDAVLMEGQISYLALARDNQPYLVPLNFLYEKGLIYFHFALEGLDLPTQKSLSRKIQTTVG
jgi:uncharacterized protein